MDVITTHDEVVDPCQLPDATVTTRQSDMFPEPWVQLEGVVCGEG